MAGLGLEAAPVATQTYPRKQDYRVLSALAGLGGTLYKFAFDLRVLQSPPIGEWAEPFGARQVGSSAMPFKRNPIHSENMDSLARLLAALPRVAWDNAAHSLLERTLDDSANRRTLLPEAFLIADELLRRGQRLIEGLQVRPEATARLLATYGVFAATERLLMECVKRGGDRQELHEVIRDRSLAAWAEVQAGRPNPLRDSAARRPGDRALCDPGRSGCVARRGRLCRRRAGAGAGAGRDHKEQHRIARIISEAANSCNSCNSVQKNRAR